MSHQMIEKRFSKGSFCAFSLIEVVLAIGVLSLSVITLLGLWGIMMRSVERIVAANEAPALVSRVNAEIQNRLSFGEVFRVASGGALYYVWKQQADPSGSLSLEMSSSASQLLVAFDRAQVVGRPFVVTFSRGLADSDYWRGSDPELTEGYVPVFVMIFTLNPNQLRAENNLLNVSGFGVDFEGALLQPSELVFAYTTAKTRSF